mgnify:CR=1 FL=1
MKPKVEPELKKMSISISIDIELLKAFDKKLEKESSIGNVSRSSVIEKYIRAYVEQQKMKTEKVL